MADRNGDGTLLQIFSGAVGDRPTLFFELIQRLGCGVTTVSSADSGTVEVLGDASSGEVCAHRLVSEMAEGDMAAHARFGQVPGCGGFGKGNIKELYASMEKYDARLKDETALGGEADCAMSGTL